MARKLFVFVLVLAMVAAVSAGCKPKLPAHVDASQLHKEQVIRYNVGTEPETLDPAKSTGIPEFNMQLAIWEGLMRLDSKSQPAFGAAEKVDVSPDLLTYTFTLRKGLKWSNGEPLTAADFEYSWKRALDPDTAADYAYMLYYIKGGEAYNGGTGKVEDVGVKAKDARTLVVTLEAPCKYFLSLCAFGTYYPVNKKIVEADSEWYTKAEKLIGNGPFKVSKWSHNDRIEFVKNPNYWDTKSVVLEKLVFTMVEEDTTELAMFESGEIDFADNPPSAELARLTAEKKLGVNVLLGTYYYIFNVEKKPLDDVRVRKALTLAIDRKAIVETVTKGGQVPALAFVPPGIPDASGNDFRKSKGDYFKDADVATAKALLADAGYPNGKGFPSLEILYNTSAGHKRIAEAIQEMWKVNLGITSVTLRNLEWGMYLAARDEGDFQIARAGWLGDFLDPMTFIDMWLTGGGNNNSRWGLPEYDALVEKARKSADQAVRMKTMHDAEALLMRDMPIAPIYYYVDLFLMKPYVKGVMQSALGPIDFKNAWVAKH
ncbi:MAG: peptide ABC transporter substrate-binding protein [Bacillota bacterium]